MFTGAMDPSEKEDIEIPDIEYSVFVALLKFLYSDIAEVDSENATALLYAAKKYAVRGLEVSCVGFLIEHLSPDNAMMLLSHARLFDEKVLSNVSVLDRDTLRVREISLFLALLRWSAQQCRKRAFYITPENQRKILAPLLQKIRFPLMAVDEFAEHVAQSGILTDKELVNLFIFFNAKIKPEVPFSDVPRCTTVEQVINRFQRIEDRWGYNGAPDKIKFMVNRRIYLVGFGLYGSVHGPTEYTVKIQLINGVNGKVLACNDTSFQCDGSIKTFKVLFSEPVKLEPCFPYIASAQISGPDSHYGSKGLQRVVFQPVCGPAVTFQFSYSGYGNNNGTSVEDGQIPEIYFYTKMRG
ncbi:unnamed protein product [Soboliphyme baturini]|uniref:BTB domain-containing protein n=1 Tax=Soboliphyme baturini TaxID=241478 RepID=A0A183J093_9BILA|nr:unnamed protein product [Soboliphyme baturini]